MPVSADDLQFAIVEEVTPGVTPATPVFQVIRTTGESVAFTPTSTESQEMGGISRGVADSIQTGAEVAGAINFELAKSPALELMLSAVMASDWGDDPYSITPAPTADECVDGQKMRTFTLEKRWKVDDTPTYNYHRFVGCIINTCSMTITPNEPITGNFGIIGTTLGLDTDIILGATYQSAGTNPVMTAPLGAVAFYTYGTTTPLPWVGTSCFTTKTIEINNNGRGIACIGTLGTKETVFGKFFSDTNGSVLYTADDLLQGLIDQTDYAMQVDTADSLGNEYDFYWPRVKLTTNTVVAGGTGEDVLNDYATRGLIDEALGGPLVTKITKVTV